MEINIKYNFLPLGSTAPSKLNKDEIWLDIGNRCDIQVLDHHSGDADSGSAIGLVYKHFQKLILEPIKGVNEVRLVTHEKPDLDAISAVWLTQLILRNGLENIDFNPIETIVRAVTENDQGHVKNSSPETSWSIVMRLLLGLELDEEENQNRLVKGLKFLDQTLEILTEKGDLSSAARHIITPNVQLVINQATRDYLEDLSRATTFQIRLPVKPVKGIDSKDKKIPQNPPEYPGTRWSIADGIFIENPTSKLFKELAREDLKNSILGQGFSLLIVSSDIPSISKIHLHRHVISTDPSTGLYLKGLGKLLEEKEQLKENEQGLEILIGRERVNESEGRHGYNVQSPWYDGRGHDFTIIDSPSIKVENENVLASYLTPNEVMNIVWEYGDPARFMELQEYEVTILKTISFDQNFANNGWDEMNISKTCPDLCEQVKLNLDKFLILSSKESADLKENNFKLVEQQLWSVDQEVGVWIGIFKADESKIYMRDLAKKIHNLKKLKFDQFLPKGIKYINIDPGSHLIHCRINNNEISIEDKQGFSALVLYRLASGHLSNFFTRADDDELNATTQIFSTDHRNLFIALNRGLLVLSTRNVAYKNENDFHRPENFRILTILIYLYKVALDSLSTQFSISRSFVNPIKASKRIINDRWKLIYLEQEMSFDRVSDRRFAQRSFEEIQKVFGIEKRYSELKRKIISLEEQLKSLRSNYYQMIAFFVTTVLAPLAITASFFSGTQMQKQFSKIHFTFFPAEWQPAGWIQFGLVFLAVSIIVTSIWLVIKLLFTRNSVLAKFFKRIPD